MPRYWFRAKRYGWGWGLPLVWEGWLVLLLFVALLAAGAFLFSPAHSLVSYLIYALILAAIVLVICVLKGEPQGEPRGRR
ncbi:MAG: hypothetical protein AB1508_12530 [Pseudomonadota bacterium]